MNEEALAQAESHNPSDPGKFEGEPKETVYFYFCMMDGDGESVGKYTTFKVEDDEMETFGLVESHFSIWEDGNGFVYGRQCSDKCIAEMEALAE